MYDEVLDAIRYQAAEALQPDGSIRVPDMLIEQLSEEFGIDVDSTHDPLRPRIERTLAYYNDPGVLTVADIADADLVEALNVGGRRGGKVGAVLKVLAKAITYLDAHAGPREALEYASTHEESYPPALIVSAFHTGMEESALYSRFTAAAESGCDFSHVIDSNERPDDVALLAIRESCCISSVITALEENLNG